MTVSKSSHRWRVLSGTAAVLICYAAALGFVNFISLEWTGLMIGLRLPLAVFIVQAAVIFLLTAGICAVKLTSKFREWSAATRQGAIEKMVAALASTQSSGQGLHFHFDPHWLKHPEEIALKLEAMLLTTKGESRERLSRLASEIGLTAHWMLESRRRGGQRRRLAIRMLGLVDGYTIPHYLRDLFADQDPAVRIAVYRAMLKTGGEDGIELVFNALSRESLLICALVNSELGKHAAILGPRAIPRAIQTADSATLKRILDMAGAWRRAVTIPGLGELLRTADSGVQRRILELLPYLKDEADGQERLQLQLVKLASTVMAGLDEEDEELRAAAAAVAGQFGNELAVPLLLEGLTDGRHSVVRNSARALAHLGPAGIAVLEAQVLTSRGLAASAANEALEQAQFGFLPRGAA